MPENEAQFDFEKFKVKIRYIGDQDGPAYETSIEAPGFEPVNSGVILKRLPLFSSAARAAVSQFRTLLSVGVKTFLDDYRQNTRISSLKEIQDMRLMLLSWHDTASAIGDQALASAEAELKAEEAKESAETYGKEQAEEKEEQVEYDKHYDLGPVVISLHYSGVLEIFPLWGVTATIPGTDMQAHTYIGMESVIAAHAAQAMIQNLKSVLTLGVERYFIENELANRTPITESKQRATETLYAVAHEIGMDGLAVAEQKIEELIEQERVLLEDAAIAQEEAGIAVRKERLKKR